MRIAVLGTGNFGMHTGLGLRAAGHDVVHGARDLGSDSVRRLLGRHPDTEVVGLGEAVVGSDLVVVATAPDSLDDIARVPGIGSRIVIDTSNALDWSVRPPRMAVDRSQAEVLVELLPGARVVKAFNTLRAEHMSDAAFSQGPAVTFVCGDDGEARSVVMGLAEELGFEPVDAGGIENAYALEQAAALWIGIAARDGYGRTTALSLTHRPET